MRWPRCHGGAAGATTFGTEDIRLGAPAVRSSVDRVRAWTGAARVDVVGYRDRCPVDMTGHFRMPYDAVAESLVLEGLGGTPSSDACRPVALGEGIGDVILDAPR